MAILISLLIALVIGLIAYIICIIIPFTSKYADMIGLGVTLFVFLNQIGIF